LDEQQHQQVAGEVEKVQNSVSMIFVTSGDAIWDEY